MNRVLIAVLLMLAAGCSSEGETARSASSGSSADSAALCPEIPLHAPHIRMADPGHRARSRTGPGEELPEHSTSPLDRRTRIYVLQECGEWVRARLIPAGLIRRETVGLSEEQARAKITFWVRADQIR